MLRTILVITLFSLSSLFSSCDKACADGIGGKLLEVLQKATSSNSPKSNKSKKDKSASKDSSIKYTVKPSGALAGGGLGGYEVFKFGMSADEINKKTACNLEAVPESKGIVPGIDILVCRDFSFDNQRAVARFAFADGALEGLGIIIPLDKKNLKSLPEKYASMYGAPTFVSPKADFDAWEKGDPYAEISFKYSNGTTIVFSIYSESDKHDEISIVYSSEKLNQLIDAVELSANFNVDPITGTCPLEVHFNNKSSGCEVHFNNKSSGCKEGRWDFGDGGKSAEPNPTHIYNKPGTYTVKLTVSNKIATDEITKIVQVLPEELSAGFTSVPTRGIVPLEVQFTDSSRGDPEKWYWDFGDGSESDQQSPTHIYKETGTYTVKLTVSNQTAKVVEDREIVVYQGAADLTVSAAYDYAYCFDRLEPIQFTDKSTGKPISWAWDFGDGGRSNEQNPVYSYHSLAKNGRYTVTLTVTYAGGHISIMRKPDCVILVSEKFWLDTRNSLSSVLMNTAAVRIFLSAIFPKGNLDESMLDKIIRKQVSYQGVATTASSNLYKDANHAYNIEYRADLYVRLLDSKRFCLGILRAAQLAYEQSESQSRGVPKALIYNRFTGSDDGARVLEDLERELTGRILY